MTLLDLLVPTYRQMLGALAQWVGKAEEQQPDGAAEALLSARLAPDMFPLSTQIRFACVQAHEGVCRMLGRDFPPVVDTLLNEGREAGERPGSLAEAREVIAQTLAFLDDAVSAAPNTHEPREIAHALPTGMVFDLTAEQYGRDWAQPQFYFHLMSAYAVLRAEGIDYVAHMFAYLRPGTMPGA